MKTSTVRIHTTSRQEYIFIVTKEEYTNLLNLVEYASIHGTMFKLTDPIEMHWVKEVTLNPSNITSIELDEDFADWEE